MAVIGTASDCVASFTWIVTLAVDPKGRDDVLSHLIDIDPNGVFHRPESSFPRALIAATWPVNSSTGHCLQCRCDRIAHPEAGNI